MRPLEVPEKNARWLIVVPRIYKNVLQYSYRIVTVDVPIAYNT